MHLILFYPLEMMNLRDDQMPFDKEKQIWLLYIDIYITKSSSTLIICSELFYSCEGCLVKNFL